MLTVCLNSHLCHAGLWILETLSSCSWNNSTVNWSFEKRRLYLNPNPLHSMLWCSHQINHLMPNQCLLPLHLLPHQPLLLKLPCLHHPHLLQLNHRFLLLKAPWLARSTVVQHLVNHPLLRLGYLPIIAQKLLNTCSFVNSLDPICKSKNKIYKIFFLY